MNYNIHLRMITYRLKYIMYIWIIGLIISFYLTGCGVLSDPVAPNVPSAESHAMEVLPSILNNLTDMHNAKFAYIAEGNGHVFICSIESTNQLGDCKTTGSSANGSMVNWLPDDVAFYTMNNINYAYVVSNDEIFICSLVANALANCHTTGKTATQNEVEWLPNSIKFINESGITYAYISGFKTVYHCMVGGDGNLNDCQATGVDVDLKELNWLPNIISFQQISGHDYAYIASSKSIFQCQVGDGADLIKCHSTGSDSRNTKMRWHPSNIVFTRQWGGFFAYVADPNHLYVCNVNDNGEIINCTATGLNMQGQFIHWLANGMAFNYANNKKYAYVSGVYGIYLCNANDNGHLTQCSLTGDSSFGAELKWNPNSIILRQ